jgi:hypothetical protein
MVKEIFSYMEDDRLKDMDIAGLSGDDVERLIQEEALVLMARSCSSDWFMLGWRNSPPAMLNFSVCSTTNR